MDQTSVAHRIAHALKRHGVEVIFGQSLPSAVILASEAIGIRQLAYRQENMGGAMADGYARISGRPAVVAAQNGPAATLLVPPLSEALKASVPVVALVQDVELPHFDRNAFQELDHVALFQSCAKSVTRLLTPDRVDDVIDQAFIAATSGRPGPAVVLLPADVLRASVAVPHDARKASYGRFPLDVTSPCAADIARAANILAEASAPFLIAGGGVAMSPGAPAALAELMDLCGLPAATTNMGKGVIDEGHPLACGVMSNLNGPRSIARHIRPLLAEADVVILAGTRTNQNGTDNWRLISPQSTVIHIDIDPREIGRNYEADVRLAGDTGETLRLLCEHLRASGGASATDRRPATAQRITAAWRALETEREEFASRPRTPIRPEFAMSALQSQLTPDSIVVADASYSSMWVVGELRSLRAGMRFLTPRGLAGLGWGLPLAMGAKVAAPQSPVIAVVGDGGFAHAWAELETMVRSGVQVVVIVLNNGVLGFQRDAELVKFGAFSTACHFCEVDHAAIARACGCRSVRVADPLDVANALREALAADEPTLIELMVDPSAKPPLSLFG